MGHATQVADASNAHGSKAVTAPVASEAPAGNYAASARDSDPPAHISPPFLREVSSVTERELIDRIMPSASIQYISGSRMSVRVGCARDMRHVRLYLPTANVVIHSSIAPAGPNPAEIAVAHTVTARRALAISEARRLLPFAMLEYRPEIDEVRLAVEQQDVEAAKSIANDIEVAVGYRVPVLAVRHTDLVRFEWPRLGTKVAIMGNAIGPAQAEESELIGTMYNGNGVIGRHDVRLGMTSEPAGPGSVYSLGAYAISARSEVFVVTAGHLMPQRPAPLKALIRSTSELNASMVAVMNPLSFSANNAFHIAHETNKLDPVRCVADVSMFKISDSSAKEHALQLQKADLVSGSSSLQFTDPDTLKKTPRSYVALPAPPTFLGTLNFDGSRYLGDCKRTLRVVGHAERHLAGMPIEIVYLAEYIAGKVNQPPETGDSGGPAITQDGLLHSFIKGSTTELESNKQYIRLTPAHFALQQLRVLSEDPTLHLLLPT